ncbi:P-loop containing nucleoside triphosphate hydrolase protein [Lentinula aff. lateritia]|uniref:P-loop containing nucleoside triphosphate hydrolase protein n=1 Tax=Lentinula aff. lateritia TaxID=2804960 RepID=A0ACC1U2T3_9AGAR|nr:P-loop containing nucleoside triphosphate hydrolase protein [Lentinula aff. lateritia]
MSSLLYRHVIVLTRTSSILTVKRNLSAAKFSAQIFEDPQSAEQVHSSHAAQLKVDDDGTQSDIFPRLKGLPEVVITGRANSGKSSLFNAVLGRKDLIATSSKPGKTRRLDFFRVGAAPGKLILVDSPGYGNRGRPEWGLLFDSYVKNRQELKRVYITFNAKHPVNDRDRQMLAHLSRTLFEVLSTNWAASFQSRDLRLPHITQIQPVITKADCLPSTTAEAQLVIDRLKKDIHSAIKHPLEDSETGRMGISSDEMATLMCLSPLVTTVRSNPPFGIESVRRSIVEACNLPG